MKSRSRILRKFVFFALCLLCSVCCYTSSGEVSIVKNGQATACIIVAQDAPSTVHFAAKELQKYLKKISNVELTIRVLNSDTGFKINSGENYIFIGESQATKDLKLSAFELPPDGFKVIAKENWVALLGNDYLGNKTIEGVNHPNTKRNSYNQKLDINRFGASGTLYAVYNFLEDVCGVRWYMPGDLGEVIPVSKNIALNDLSLIKSPDFETRSLYSFVFDSDADMSLWYRRAGFGGPYPLNISHSFIFFNKYRQAHPEYFAVSGKRDNSKVYLCLSNNGVVEQWAKDICEYFKQNPEQKIFPLVPEDSLLSICECEKCQAQITASRGQSGLFSDYVWGFVNRVATEVYKKYPDKLIGCLAYETYALPPEKIKEFSPNIAVMITKFRMNSTDKVYINNIYAMIEDWTKFTKHIYIWEYYNYYLQEAYLKNFPVIFPHIIAADLKHLKGISKGEFIEAETSHPVNYMRNRGFMHLNLYVTAKLQWNADADVDAILKEYYSKFYGPAEKEMEKFFMESENLWVRQRNSIISPEITKKLKNILLEARKKVGDDLYRKRIDLLLSEIEPAATKEWIFEGKNPSVPLLSPKKAKDLVAYWKFVEGKGAIVNDSSGNNLIAKIFNCKWMTDNNGSSLNFNGYNSYVEITGANKLPIKDQMTIEGWFFWGDMPKMRCGLVFNTSYNYLLYNECTKIFFRLWNDNKITVSAGFWQKDIDKDEWNHIVGTYDGQKIKIYLNGKIKDSAIMTGNIKPSAANSSIYIGKRDNCGDIFFNGLVDEVRIYSRALNDEEVQNNYQTVKNALLHQKQATAHKEGINTK